VLATIATSVQFGFCFVELDREGFACIREIHRVLSSRLEPGGGIMICWINSGCESPDSLQAAFAECALMASEGAAVRFFSSASGWGSLGALGTGPGKARLRRWARLGAGFLGGFLRFGNRRPIEGQSPLQNCWGAIIEIGFCNRASVPSQTVPPAPMIQPSTISAEVGATL
jgi:hypothetical protein